jgi:hypothetical protein
MLKVYETSGKVLFEEKQGYTKWLRWMMQFSMSLTVMGLLIGLITEREKTGMMMALALVIPAAALAIYLNANTELEKIVTSNAMYYRWKPFHKKFRVIEKEAIESFVRRKFHPFSYGFGWFPGYGRYFNANTGEGLQLYLKGGKRIYFSASDVESFETAINHLVNPVTKSSFA